MPTTQKVHTHLTVHATSCRLTQLMRFTFSTKLRSDFCSKGKQDTRRKHEWLSY